MKLHFLSKKNTDETDFILLHLVWHPFGIKIHLHVHKENMKKNCSSRVLWNGRASIQRHRTRKVQTKAEIFNSS